MLIGATIIVVLTLTIFFPALEGEALERTIGCSVIVMVALFGGAWWWGWQAPARRFARRAPAGPLRTIQEARARALREIGWGQLGLSVLIGLYLGVGLLRGEIVTPMIGGAVLAGGCIQAARKLLLERRTPR
jgi:hypothetical protein